MNRAVLVGINQYLNQPHLAGCVNDVVDLKKALVTSTAVASGQIVMLTDTGATRANILRALGEMVGALEPGDSGYFHYSGHGAHMPSSDPQEAGALDEVLCPHEFDWSAETAIADHEMLQQIGGLTLGARMVLSFDCCHSGDMARVETPHGRPRCLEPPSHLHATVRLVRHGFRTAGRMPFVSFVSACSPWELAADASFHGRSNGAFTYYFLKELDAAPIDQSLSTTTDAIEPQLHPFDMKPEAENGEGTYFHVSDDERREHEPVRILNSPTWAGSMSPTRAA